MWLDQAALAGEAYQQAFDQLSQNLEDQLDSILEAIRSPASKESETISPSRLAAALAGDQTS